MLTPSNRFINPNVGYYGTVARIGSECYINTGRIGEMTDFFEYDFPVYQLQDDNSCPYGFFQLNASTHDVSSTELGSGSSALEYLDASVHTVEKGVNNQSRDQIRFLRSQIHSHGITTTPESYMYMCRFTPLHDITTGHAQVNLWSHQDITNGETRGFIIALSSDHSGNTGQVSVMIGTGSTNQWNVYTTSDLHFNALQEYHLSVVQNTTSLTIYVDNVMVLNQNTSSIQPGLSKYSITAPGNATIPVNIEDLLFVEHIPLIPDQLVDQHYNRVSLTPVTVPGVLPEVMVNTAGTGCPSPIEPWLSTTNEYYLKWHGVIDPGSTSVWKTIDTYSVVNINGDQVNQYDSGPQPISIVSSDNKLIAHTSVIGWSAGHTSSFPPEDVILYIEYLVYSAGTQTIKNFLYNSIVTPGHITGLSKLI
jgi:hypothetical protein